MTATVHRTLTPIGGPSHPHNIETRWRCITDRHEPVTHNPWMNATFCQCGRVIRPGDCGRFMTEVESREAWPDHHTEIDHLLGRRP